MKLQRPDDYHPWSTYVQAREEARALGDRRVGTDHLVLALLQEPAVAAALGCGPDRARATLYELDREALAPLGIELPATDPSPPQLPRDLRVRPRLKEVLHRRLPLTPAAKRALSESSRELRRGRRHPGPQHVMQALLELRAPDPAAELFRVLGIETVRAGERLRAES